MVNSEISNTLLSYLQKGLHKSKVDELAAEIIASDVKMQWMVSFALHHEGTIGMKASWILGAASVQQPGAADKYMDAIITRLGDIKTMGTKRELLKTLLHSNIFEAENLGMLVDVLFRFLRSSEEDISVSYNSMKVMEKILRQIPDLKTEFFDTLQHQMPYMSDTWKKLARSIIAKG